MDEMTVREAAEELGLTHLEVNRRIHKGQIQARKVGWVWILNRKDVLAVKKAEWYKRVMRRRKAATA